ncbi:hypothetical protein RIF29_30050 [Crotalaria pallida]|uniref:Uncharacterized protein n=1 Tax=Crotalaria pallida TaxID=3830 RepID=A0AAN9EFZ0_CROPI
MQFPAPNNTYMHTFEVNNLIRKASPPQEKVKGLSASGFSSSSSSSVSLIPIESFLQVRGAHLDHDDIDDKNLWRKICELKVAFNVVSYRYRTTNGAVFLPTIRVSCRKHNPCPEALLLPPCIETMVTANLLGCESHTTTLPSKPPELLGACSLLLHRCLQELESCLCVKTSALDITC